jgi:hypothetical protein
VSTLIDRGPAGRMGRSARLRPPAWVALLGLLPFLLLVASHWSEAPPLGADDYGHYLMHAKALAQGRPYSDIGYIYTPYNPWIGPAATPPGLPLTLSAVLTVVGTNEHVLKLSMVAFGAVFFLLAGRYFALHDERLLGLGVTVLTGLSPSIVNSSIQIQTDLPFAALVWAVIHLYDLPGPWRPSRLVFITILGACAVLYRTAGLALIPAIGVFTWMRFREHRLVPAIPIVAWGVGLLIAAALWRPVGFTTEILPADGYQALRWIRANVIGYRFVLFESHLYPFGSDRLDDLFHVFSAAVMAVGLAVWLRQAFTRFLVAFAVVYTVTLISVPVAAPRYFWPLAPLLIFGLLNGVRLLARVARPSLAPRTTAVVALAAGLGIGALAVVTGASEPRPVSMVRIPAVQALFTHLARTSTAGQPRVVFIKPRALAWETGIPAMGPPIAPPDIVLAELRRRCITHVIIGDLGLDVPGHRRLREAVETHPNAFAIDYRNERFSVYRFTEWASDRCARSQGPPQSGPLQ